MADIIQAKVWLADDRTGGTVNDLDGKGQDSAKPIGANHVAFIIVNDNFEVFLCKSSGESANGVSIIAPVASALSNAGDADLRWHRHGSGAQNFIGITIPHSNWPTGFADVEIWRLLLGSAEVLRIHDLQLNMQGGGAVPAGLSIDVAETADNITYTSLVSSSDITPLPIDSTAAMGIVIRVSNSTGAVQAASIWAKVEIVA